MNNQVSSITPNNSASAKKQSGFKRYNKYKKEDWYKNLAPDRQEMADIIFKNHEYYSKRDKHYRIWVRLIKFIILFITLINTIILGVKGWLTQDSQVNIGLILSAVISFVTALFTYFNLEEYWMRNISIHIKLNILRDEFVIMAKANRIDNQQFDEYIKKLTEIQQENITYWEKASKKI